ncbi:hypothetical protein C1T31_13320 [Hanstruepera neustonica]|uniref:Uncharacterized protein n=1 Tax=Hanstruepera neustonica TaxID=1445657 RepID=A0A2K1DVM9_9FLAO|nr:DUF4105 domain-containing protein [Hanstruepera neustonica]PNQ72081.1 hypothetical protein C1T31_13320 [Hanstruepera neustonica]
MQIRLRLLIAFIFTQLTFAQNLSEQAQISVLTIGPGTSLNDAFGHSLFRIQDPTTRLDITYDYGRFPFDEPGFYLNFARGKLNYSIGKSNYHDIKDFYMWQNRSIDEQVLNLTLNEKQTLYHYLINNYKPKNRNYLYDFFYDNCATKIKDVLQISVTKKITFHEPDNFEPKSWRTLIQENLNYNSWGSVGIDIALGSVIDQTAKAEGYMFLPKYIHTFFGLATINASEKLVEKESTVYEHQPIADKSLFITSPLFILSILAIIILFITYRDYSQQKRSHYLDVIIFLLSGFIGIFLLLLWFATDHTATAQNYNLLWAFPLNLILIWKLKQPKNWIIKFLKFLVIMMCLLVFHWVVGIQVFAPALIPLLLALAIRYVYLTRYFKSQI